MSRSGYNGDCGGWGLICWRGAVASAIRGVRGQAFLRELAAQMDAMPDKVLGKNSLQSADGEFCTLGVVGAARGVDMLALDESDREAIGAALGIAPALAAEVMWENDDGDWRGGETPAGRWTRMRDWVQQQIDAARQPTQKEAGNVRED